MQMKAPFLTWRRSTRCSAHSCVETAADTRFVYLRDSKESDGAVLRFGRPAWLAFLDGLKRDHFTPR